MDKKILKLENRRGFAFAPLLIWGGIALTTYLLAGTAVSKTVKDFAEAILIGLGIIFLLIFKVATKMATGIFDEAVGMINKAVTTDPVFTLGWIDVRNLANMLVVLGFVAIGIATALRIREYGAQKLLLPLIIIAVLINFSGLISGIIIDASNALMKTFFQHGDGGAVGRTIYDSLDKATDSILSNSKYTSATQEEKFMVRWSLALSWAMAALTFFYLSFILVARYAVLAILYILSPLAFVFFAFPFPKAKNLWNMWWENFIKWSFIGVGGSFFAWIAIKLLNSYPEGKVSAAQLAVVLVFLFVGFKITTKSSAMGAGAVMGLAGGAAGFITGSVMGAVGAGGLAQKLGMGKGAQRGAAAGSYVGGMTGSSRAGQALQRGAALAGEKMGLVAPGTSSLIRAKQQQEHESEKRAATWSADQRKSLATGRVISNISTRGRNDKLEAIKQMAAKGELGSLAPAQLQSAMAFAASNGVPASVLAKQDYRAAGFDTKRVNALGGDAARARAEQLEANLSSMSGQQRRNISPEDITPELITSQAMNPSIIRDFRTADDAHRAKFGTSGSTATGTTGVIDRKVGEALTKAETAAIGNTREENRIRGIRAEIMRTLQQP